MGDPQAQAELERARSRENHPYSTWDRFNVPGTNFQREYSDIHAEVFEMLNEEHGPRIKNFLDERTGDPKNHSIGDYKFSISLEPGVDLQKDIDTIRLGLKVFDADGNWLMTTYQNLWESPRNVFANGDMALIKLVGRLNEIPMFPNLVSDEEAEQAENSLNSLNEVSADLERLRRLADLGDDQAQARLDRENERRSDAAYSTEEYIQKLFGDRAQEFYYDHQGFGWDVFLTLSHKLIVDIEWDQDGDIGAYVYVETNTNKNRRGFWRDDELTSAFNNSHGGSGIFYRQSAFSQNTKSIYEIIDMIFERTKQFFDQYISQLS